ncbi:hypothetical protein SAMN04487902_104180 [Prevotella sp. ne3005]|uniref:hypothetical protein n=1 Tax=Prevotella sp. ne3005 TaxID=1761887 RepID=UPI0008C144C8|nr:hypothetical protein [Prevotella sp. ne3005]SEM87288.1 hypothetical protein SAMN04487902_104180 [Prevotella sp. ne3005]
MKKYLLTSAAALAFCGLFTSCTHDFDNDGGSAAQNSVMKTYEQAFVTAFGQPDPNQEWGFGSSTVASTRAMTRTDKPTKPSFRDGNDGMPDFSKPEKPSFYNTVAEAEAAGVTVVVAGANTEPQANTTYAISNNTSFNNLQNKSGITLYVTENMKFAPSFSAGGNTIVVTRDTKLTLGGVLNEKVNVYLAPNAELILPTYEYKNIIWWPEYKEETVSTDEYSFNNNSSETPYKLYLSSGSKITGGSIQIDNGYQVLNDGGTINSTSIRVQKSTLWNEGKIDLTGDLWSYNGEASIFNAAGDTISVGGKLELTNNNDLLYNNGYMPITGDIKMKDGSNEIVNNGTLNSSSDLDMKAGGKFHNVGYATISGRSYIYNTNSYWVNDGHYTTGTFDDQNCEKVFNNCYMTVTGDFHLGVPAAANGHSFFTIEGGGEGERESGAYVYCGGDFIYGGNTDLWLGNKSYLEVIGEFKSTNINKPYGVHGPESGSYAVIKAESFTQDNNAKAAERCITFFGKLYIDAPIQYNNYVAEGTNVQFSSSHPEKPVKIPRTECNPGYGRDPEPDPSSDVIRVICEDLSVRESTDWDFNDAVFDVQLLDNDSKVKITLLAAGGTLPLTVAGEEVHGKFKEFNPDLGISTGTMLSTGSTNSTGKYDHINCVAPYYIIDNIFGSTNIREVAKKIPVQVQKLVNGEKTWVTLECEKGKATAKVAVRDNYNWCDERQHINIKYTLTDMRGNEYGGFTLYTEGIVGGAEDPERCWYNYNGPITDEMVQEHLGH